MNADFMKASVWGIPMVLGILVLGAVLALRAWRAKPRTAGLSPEARAELAALPMAPLQRRAWMSLGIGLMNFGVIAALLISEGVERYWSDDDFRLMVVGIYIAGLILHTAVLALPLFRALPSEDEVTFDERDRKILMQAPRIQSVVLILCLAAWMVGLGEAYHQAGAIPMVWLYLMFFAMLLLHGVGQSLGILFGYWRGGDDG